MAQIWAQDYPGELEVVVLDDSSESSEAKVAEFARCASMNVNYQHLPYRCSLGGKRNLAAASTEADVICLWDDDDIFPTNRISRQVSDLVGGRDCSYIETVYYYSFMKEQLNVHRKHVPGLPIENSLCFWRDWFERGRGFNAVNFGEGLWLFDLRVPEAAVDQAQPSLEALVPENVAMVPATELPFLYVKHGVSVSGDQVAEEGRLAPL
uniref:Glycosyltransferase 2-like domain-containing protein n=1 Tax=Alexandrium monilatum TaxID=311494 RepID=A0A7S4PYA1_9DINO